MKIMTLAAFAASLLAAAGTASAQSDPSQFGTVFNIGNVPPGSAFDVTGAAVGTMAGDNDSTINEASITAGSLLADTLGSNSQLNLFEGGSITNGFSAGFASLVNTNLEVNISGGSVGSDFNAFSGSTVNISAGSVGNGFDAFSGSTINISGGSIGSGFDAFSGSTVNIFGGSVGSDFDATAGSTVNISGGSFGPNFDAFGSAFGDVFGVPIGVVNISGGSFGPDFDANFGSRVNLFGTEFFIDGIKLTDLVLGEALTITRRNVTLTGVLADGSAFEFDLFNSGNTAQRDFFDNNARLTVTLIPAPASVGALALAGLATARRRRR